jgi:hypothetical protein
MLIGRTTVALVAIGVIASFAATASEPAHATHGKNCGVIAKGARDFRVLGKRLPCRRAKQGTRLYLRERHGLPGFSCTGDAGVYAFICGKGAKTYRAQRL